ncbi:hypothetical protein JHW43_008655 [Diplocarpon mali]|nr:hypothetical protein JHW43_008655 [Diplocarpon mali]
MAGQKPTAPTLEPMNYPRHGSSGLSVGGLESLVTMIFVLIVCRIWPSPRVIGRLKWHVMHPRTSGPAETYLGYRKAF